MMKTNPSATAVPITYEAPGGAPTTGMATRVSPNGFFVAVADPYRVNDQLEVRLDLPEGNSVQAHASVIYSNPGPSLGSALEQGMGLKFRGLSEVDRQVLEAYASAGENVISIAREAADPRGPVAVGRDSAGKAGAELVARVLEDVERPRRASRLGRWLRRS